MARPIVYLAGPEVFLDDARAIFRAKRRICRAHGLQPVTPFETDLPPGTRRTQARHIFRANCALIDRAEAILANLSPFRGPGCDPGTAFEVGYATAQGKPAFAYSNVPGTTLARARAMGGAALGRDGVWRDAGGVQIEDFGLAENLMLAVPAAVRRAPEPRPLGDLRMFEVCVRHAAARLGVTPRAGAAPTSRPAAGARSRR